MTGYSTQLLLASSSEYRKKQLLQLGMSFENAPPTCQEGKLQGEHPRDLALRLSRDKARSLTHTYPQHIIIGSDQTAAFENTILGKPQNEEKAIAQLLLCRGKPVIFYSGLCVINVANGKEVADVVETKVTFRPLTEKQIYAYIRKDQPLNCAGSFKCESLGIALFEKIESEDPSALVGLPLISLNKMLFDLGVDSLTY